MQMYIKLLIQIGAILVGSVVVNSIVLLLKKIVFPRLKKAKNYWHEAVFYAAYLPVQVLVWVISITIIATMLAEHFRIVALKQGVYLGAELVVVALLVWFLLRLTNYIKTKLVTKSQKSAETLDQTTIYAVAQLVRVVILVAATILVLQLIGVPISGLLAFGGVSGIILGMAAKDMLANFFGGLMIYLDRPFAVGDWIRSPDKDIEGTVEYIGWRLTRIRTFDKRPLFVPNSVFSTVSVENASRMTNRRIRTVINLRYDDATRIADLLADIRNMLKKHPQIDQELPIRVNLIECTAWSLNYLIYAFAKTKNYDEFLVIQQDVLLKMLEIVNKHGAECAFPTSTIDVPNDIKLKTEKKL